MINDKKFKLIADWEEAESLTLTFPYALHANHTRTNRESLLTFYLEFLETIDNNINKSFNIILLIQPRTLNLVKEELSYRYWKNLIFLFKEIICQDIWIRDYAPININVEGISNLTKFNYNPNYGFNDNGIDNKAGFLLMNSILLENKSVEINLDGGNISTNGEVLIMSEKVILENPNLSKDKILSFFYNYFDLEKVILLPVETYDVIGHVDSFCRFINKDTILLPLYPEYYNNEYIYIKGIQDILEAELPNIKIIFIPSDLSEEINLEGLYSAKGLYINYFRIENLFFIPNFNLLEDEEVNLIFKNINRDFKIIPITKEINKLAFLGGLLNCITWIKFK